MSEFSSEMSERANSKQMSTTEFTQKALREYIAPSLYEGEKAKTRIPRAAHKLNWTTSRTTSAWNGCPKMRIWADELAQVEQISGLKYARQEYNEIQDLISKADNLLDGTDPDFNSAFVAAFREFHRVIDSSRAKG